METSTSTPINAKPEQVWQIITDIEHSAETISGINKIEIIDQPKGTSIKGLKWKEWRKFAGKEATEVMWITEARKNSHYVARAESHGAIYLSTMRIEKAEGGCTLTMSFEGQAVTFGAKVLWFLTGWMAKGAVKKACAKDLEDIKAAAEAL